MIELFESIKERVPFTVFKVFAEQNNFPGVGRGYDGAQESLLALEEPDQSRYLRLLERFYEEHVACGEKALVFFRCNAEEMEALRKGAVNFQPYTSPYTESYPYYLGHNELLEAEDGPSLVAVKEKDASVDLIYATRRFFTERVDIRPEQLVEEAQDEFSDYEKILAIRRVYRQFFDVVSVSKSTDILTLRLDSPGDMPQGELEKAQEDMAQVTYALFGSVLSGKPPELEKVNVFPLVGALNDSPEGRICELGFITDGGGVKHSRMRLHNKDLRDEEYHKAGSNAATITPFKIGIRWGRKRAEEVYSNPELFIPGKMQYVSGQKKGRQNIFKIARCVDQDDYLFVIGKVLKYLSV